MANRCKKMPNVPLISSDRETIFTNPQEFIDHHSHGNGPKIMIIGQKVIETT